MEASCLIFVPVNTTFAFLGQTYLQSLTIRLEEMRVKRRDSEQWMHHRMLPQDLRERVRRYDQYKWLETRGVDEEYLVQNLPKDLRRDIKRHLCLALVRRVRSPTVFHSNFLIDHRTSRIFRTSRNNGLDHRSHNLVPDTVGAELINGVFTIILGSIV